MDEPTILIVEDRDDLRALIRLAIEPIPSSLLECDSVQEAWRLIELYRPSIVVLDQNLSEPLDGLGLCERIKASPQHAGIRVILVTGAAQRAQVERGYASGADAYVIKPFSPAELLAVVRAQQR